MPMLRKVYHWNLRLGNKVFSFLHNGYIGVACGFVNRGRGTIDLFLIPVLKTTAIPQARVALKEPIEERIVESLKHEDIHVALGNVISETVSSLWNKVSDYVDDYLR
jgi:hypothetical protein